jgi:Flp pilus assembly protein TadB
MNIKKPFLRKPPKEKKEKEKTMEQKIRELHKLKRLKYKKEMKRSRKTRLKSLMKKAGIIVEPHIISKRILLFSVIINSLASSFFIYSFLFNSEYSLAYLIVIISIIWTLIFTEFLLSTWLLFFILMDIRIYKNKKMGIENVLADFLQLTSANVRAGMPIDQALWYAVRPQFGILAKEIETVAKETMSGIDLDVALRRFSDKYDSLMLRRSVNLLIEGINAGGEIGGLLNKVATDIEESKIMKKELSANVMTYVIFISFATIMAAPLLFALSSYLLVVVNGIMSKLDVSGGNMNLPISISGEGLAIGDFRIFAVTCLIITSFFSSLIIATIRKGDVKAGMKYIPMFIGSTVILFIIFSAIIGKLFGGII